jgi:hypothetical protein
VEQIGGLAATKTAIPQGHPGSRIAETVPLRFKPVSTGAA